MLESERRQSVRRKKRNFLYKEFIYNFFPSPKLARFRNTANRYQKYKCVESANTSFMRAETPESV